MGTQQFNEGLGFNVGVAFDHTYVSPNVLYLLNNTGLPQRIDTLQSVNTDTVDHTLTLLTVVNSVTIELGSAIVPAGAGNGTVAVVDVFSKVLANPTIGWWSGLNPILTCYIEATPASGKFVYVFGQGGDLT